MSVLTGTYLRDVKGSIPLISTVLQYLFFNNDDEESTVRWISVIVVAPCGLSLLDPLLSVRGLCVSLSVDFLTPFR